MSLLLTDGPSFVFLVFRAVMDLFWFVVGVCHSTLAASIFANV
jgi:hypothetical protein